MPKLSTKPLSWTRIKDLKHKISRKDGKPIPATYWAADVRGFGVQVTPSDQKSYWFKYSSPVTGKQEWIRLGTVTVAKSFEDAKELAGDYRKLVDKGKDPKIEMAAKEVADAEAIAADAAAKDAEIRLNPNMTTLVDEFDRLHLEKKRKSTAKAAKSMFNRLVLADPEWANRRVKDVTFKLVEDLFTDISEGWRPGMDKEKDIPERPTPYVGNRLLAYLSSMFTFCVPRNYLPPNCNPCKHITRNPEIERVRFLSEDELVRLGQALKVQESKGRLYEVSAIRLLLFTGARHNEIVKLCWDQVNLATREIRLKVHKTSGKVGDKTIPLNNQALQILQGLEKITDKDKHPFVIQGRFEGRPLNSLQNFWEETRVLADEAIGLNVDLADVRIHDLRHTFGSVGTGLNLSLRLTGSLLGHVKEQTTRKYAHVADKPAVAASKKIGNRLAKSLKG